MPSRTISPAWSMVGAKPPVSPFMWLRNKQNRMLRPYDRVRPNDSRPPDSGDHKDRPSGTMAGNGG